jgi:hypothetical protein
MNCTVCGKKTERAGACNRCAAKVRNQLAELPQLHKEAKQFLAPSRTGSGTASTERSIGINVSALDFTMATDCAGSYGPCNDNVKTWDLLLSPYPYDRPCRRKGLLPCVSKSPRRSPRVATTPSSDPDPDPDPDPDKEPDPEPETPWYEKPLYIGLIAAGVVVLVLVIVFSMGGSPPPSPSNSLNKLPT